MSDAPNACPHRRTQLWYLIGFAALAGLGLLLVVGDLGGAWPAIYIASVAVVLGAYALVWGRLGTGCRTRPARAEDRTANPDQPAQHSV